MKKYKAIVKTTQEWVKEIKIPDNIKRSKILKTMWIIIFKKLITKILMIVGKII